MDHTGVFYKSWCEEKYFGSHSEGTDVWHFFSCFLQVALPEGAVPSSAPPADEVLTHCSSHLPAWAGSGQTWDRAIYKQNIAHFVPSLKQSAMCVGTILFKHSRQPVSCVLESPRASGGCKTEKNLALLYSCALGRMSDTSVEALAAFPSLLEVCLLQHTAQDPSWSWAGRERSQQA